MTEINEYNGAFLPDDDDINLQPRTAEEIAELKRSWLRDGCWDIEDTEGFGYHYMELRRWREGQEEEWRRIEEARVQARADHMGFSYSQMCYLEGLERQIRGLEKQNKMLLDSIENGY